MKVSSAPPSHLACALGAALTLSLTGCAPKPLAPFPSQPTSAPATVDSTPPLPSSSGLFPCSDCHQNLDPNQRVRVLEEHTDIRLDHGDPERWCFNCHDLVDRDRLHLIGGTPIAFADSTQLCGQCHEDRYRQWRLGIHGKRTGDWNGNKHVFSCVHCHDPHSPHFKSLKPLPPPLRAGAIR